MFALRQRRQILFFLSFSSELINMIRAQRIMSRHGNSNGPIDAREFFDRGRILHVSERRASVFFRKQNTEQPKLAELWDELDRKMLRFVPLHHMRRDLGFGEL